MRIVNKKRFILAIMILIALIITFFSNCSAVKKVETEDYIVTNGDTLWSIATEYKHEKQDIREYVYQLRKLNNIDCIIYPGQVLKIIK